MKCQYRPIAKGDGGVSWRPKPCPRDASITFLTLHLCVEHAAKAREIQQEFGTDATLRFLGVLSHKRGASPCPGEGDD